MPTNFYMYFIAAIIPLFVGALYYSKAAFGTAWMNVNGFTDSDLQGGNMLVIFGLTYIFGLFLAFIISGIAIHQIGAFAMMLPDIGESGSAAQQQFNELMAQYGGRYRSFGHGALHGALVTILLILPVIAIGSLFERRGWKYILIHSGYWLICTTLMGGLLCWSLEYAPLS